MAMDSFLNVNLWLKYCWQAHVTSPLHVASSTQSILYDFLLPYSKHFYFLVVGVENYCCIWSYSGTHTLCRTPLDEGSAPSQRPLHVQDTTFTSDRHPHTCGIRIRNSQQASGRRPMPQTARLLGSVVFDLNPLVSFDEKYNFEALHYVIISLLPCVPPP